MQGVDSKPEAELDLMDREIIRLEIEAGGAEEGNRCRLQAPSAGSGKRGWHAISKEKSATQTARENAKKGELFDARGQKKQGAGAKRIELANARAPHRISRGQTLRLWPGWRSWGRSSNDLGGMEGIAAR